MISTRPKPIDGPPTATALAKIAAADEVLAGRAAHQAAPTVLPAPALLPPAERRRAETLLQEAAASDKKDSAQ